jgi:hypothetical protein
LIGDKRVDRVEEEDLPPSEPDHAEEFVGKPGWRMRPHLDPVLSRMLGDVEGGFYAQGDRH